MSQRKLFIVPSGGHIFRNEAGEKTFMSNDTFEPTDEDVSTLETAPFDITIQAVADNIQTKLNAVKAEIQTAIENFEE